MLAAVPVTAMLGLGLGYVLVGADQLMHGIGDRLDLAVVVAVALVVTGAWWFVISRAAASLWRRLRTGRRGRRTRREPHGPCRRPAATGTDRRVGASISA